jgi:hypothetical protein
METIDLTGAVQDDWLKVANPDYRKSEFAAHDAAETLHEQAEDEAEDVKEVAEPASYNIALPEFYPDPWPTLPVIEQLAEAVVQQGLSWQQVIAGFKQQHHLEDGQWVANVQPAS